MNGIQEIKSVNKYAASPAGRRAAAAGANVSVAPRRKVAAKRAPRAAQSGC